MVEGDPGREGDGLSDASRENGRGVEATVITTRNSVLRGQDPDKAEAATAGSVGPGDAVRESTRHTRAGAASRRGHSHGFGS